MSPASAVVVPCQRGNNSRALTYLINCAPITSPIDPIDKNKAQPPFPPVQRVRRINNDVYSP